MGGWIRHRLWLFPLENTGHKPPWELGSAWHKALWRETVVGTESTWWGRVAKWESYGRAVREAQCRLERGDAEREKTEQASDLGAGLGPTALPVCSTTGKVLKPTGLLYPASFSLFFVLGVCVCGCWFIVVSPTDQKTSTKSAGLD